MSFNEKYNRIKEFCAKDLLLVEKKVIEGINVYPELNTDILEFVKAPSKRIRPVLGILYTKALGYELNNSQLEVLSAIELVHNASLIHDDVIDESDLRRGKQSLNSKFGAKLSVISGDYLLSVAMEKISKINSIPILEIFSNTLKQMCIGEINQNFSRYKIGTIDDYIEKSKNKTGYLFQTAIVSCLMAGEKDFDLNNAEDFGLNTGIAFQIRDDLLNLIGTDLSKPSKSDIIEGIYNAPIIYSNNIDDYSDGIEKTKILLNNYIENAEVLLKNLPQSDYKSALEDFLELLRNE